MGIKLAQVDISCPLPDTLELGGHSGLWVLVRDRGVPVGYVRLRGCGETVTARRLAAEITSQLGYALATRDLYKSLLPRIPGRAAYRPFISVLVCTRDRPECLRTALDSLMELRYPNYEVLVVDNAPSDDRTKRLMREYPFRYTVEPIPGHSWVRNRAIRASTGEIVAFLDDDMTVDNDWLRNIADMMADPEIMSLSGAVIPMELESDAQVEFEAVYGGFNRGFVDKVFRAGHKWNNGLQGLCHDAGPFMVFRRSVFREVGLFDTALGGKLGGGEDVDLIHRIIRAGFTVAYSGSAIRYHKHRVTPETLAKQLHGYGCSYLALLTKCLLHDKGLRLLIFRRIVFYYRHWVLRRIVRRLLGREPMPTRYVLAESIGALKGPLMYFVSLRNARRLEKRYLAASAPAAGRSEGHRKEENAPAAL